MDKALPTIVIAAIFVLVIVLMVLSWRRRTRRDAAHAPRPVAADARGTELASANVLYVATTAHGEPLQRLAVTGLGFRGKARLVVFDGGVSLTVVGADEVFIAASELLQIAQATWTIDRVVEKDGLVLVAWRGGEGVAIDSYVRVVDADDRMRLMAAMRTICPAATPSTTSGTTGTGSTN